MYPVLALHTSVDKKEYNGRIVYAWQKCWTNCRTITECRAKHSCSWKKEVSYCWGKALLLRLRGVLVKPAFWKLLTVLFSMSLLKLHSPNLKKKFSRVVINFPISGFEKKSNDNWRFLLMCFGWFLSYHLYWKDDGKPQVYHTENDLDIYSGLVCLDSLFMVGL